jgi:hypothetical protein
MVGQKLIEVVCHVRFISCSKGWVVSEQLGLEGRGFDLQNDVTANDAEIFGFVYVRNREEEMVDAARLGFVDVLHASVW